MKKPRISKKVLETYLQCSRLGPNNCNDIYFAFEDMEQEIDRLNKIIDELEKYIQLKMFSSLNDKEDLCEISYKLQELKEEGKE